MRLTDTTREMVARLGELTGADADDPDALAAATGAASGFLRSTLRTTTNPTGLTAGYKHNVIPDRAEALIDVRALPGTEDAALADIRRIVGDDVEVEIVHQDIGLEVPFDGDLVDAMVAALGRHDPGVPVIPYLHGRRHRQQGARLPRHRGLRLRAAAAARRSRLHRHVPRRGRARAASTRSSSGSAC